MDNALIQVKEGQPVVSTEVLADGFQVTHQAVLKLIKKYGEFFQKMRPFGFEIRMGAKTGGGGVPVSYANLNEEQATFLGTLLKNTERVVDFKARLVQAFFRARQELLNSTQKAKTPTIGDAKSLYLSYYDLARTYGHPKPKARALAFQQVQKETGFDFSWLDPKIGVLCDSWLKDTVAKFCDEWESGKAMLPFQTITLSDLHATFLDWLAQTGSKEKPGIRMFSNVLGNRYPRKKTNRLRLILIHKEVVK